VRFSPNSLDVVYIAGFGAHPPAPMVTVSRTDGTEVAIAPGHHPGWPASVHIVFCPPEDGVVLIADVMTGFVRPSDIPAGNTLTAAAGKVAVHRTDPRRVLTGRRRTPYSARMGGGWPTSAQMCRTRASRC
jgi:hypothetical protein